MSRNLSGSAVQDLNRICRYLALDDFGHKALHPDHLIRHIGAQQFDIVAVFGNQVLATITQACSLIVSGLGDRLLLSGGRGHSTLFLFQNIARSARYGYLVQDGSVCERLSEAEMFAVIAKSEFGISACKVLIENSSTNTGENVRFSLGLIGNEVLSPRRILVMQDPIMQRRTMLTLGLAARNRPCQPLLYSRSVFVPEFELQMNGGLRLRHGNELPWQKDRFLSLVLGEIERIRNDERGYGPRGRGFIPAIEIPHDVLSAYENLREYTDGR
jgi:uncharacterized SAM-binding protein YcdF (DUF218 family)